MFFSDNLECLAANPEDKKFQKSTGYWVIIVLIAACHTPNCLLTSLVCHNDSYSCLV